jgi:lipoprotein-releasing system permease protein
VDIQLESVLLVIAAPATALLVAFLAIFTTGGMAGAIARRAMTKLRPTLASAVMCFAVLGTTLAVAALTVVTGISSGFISEFQHRVLGVNAHIVILRYGFAEYRQILEGVRQVPGVVGVSPFVLNEMMIVSGHRLAGILLKGVDTELMPTVLDVPNYVRSGSIDGLRRSGSEAPSAAQPTWLRQWSEGEPDPPRYEEEAGLAGVVPTGEGPEASRDELDLAIAEALGVDARHREPAPDVEDSTTLPGVMLGQTLARELDVVVGDTLRIVTPLAGLDRSLWAPEEGSIRSREFRVAGVFYSGFDEYDRRLALVDMAEAQSFGGQGDVATGLELRVTHPSVAKEIAEELQRQLGPGFRIIDWSELNQNLFAALQLQKMALMLVVSALVLVAALLVIATLVMMINERKQEIAILKAMGARDVSVMHAFALIGAAVGTLGTTFGVTLGMIICAFLATHEWQLDPAVYLIDRLPIAMNPTDLLLISGVSLAVTLIAAILPAWFTAARMKPIEGLKQE